MKISVIIASYNYENYIAKAIESIISQTYQNWEIIIVDDGSKDNSIEVINKYLSDKIHLYQHEGGINKGLKETVKLGLEKSTGDYIAFLECDDFWEPNCLEERINIIKGNEDVGLIFNDVELFGDEEAIRSLDKNLDVREQMFKNINFPENIFPCLLTINPILTFSSLMVKKEVMKKCDFNTPVNPWLDWWIYYQMTLDSKVFYTEKKLTHWLRHKESFINTGNRKKIKFNKDAFLTEAKRLALKTKELSLTQKIILNTIGNPKIEKVFRGLIRANMQTFIKLWNN